MEDQPEEYKLSRTAIIQAAIHAYNMRNITHEKMCKILHEVGADEIAKRFKNNETEQQE